MTYLVLFVSVLPVKGHVNSRSPWVFSVVDDSRVNAAVNIRKFWAYIARPMLTKPSAKQYSARPLLTIFQTAYVADDKLWVDGIQAVQYLNDSYFHTRVSNGWAFSQTHNRKTEKVERKWFIG